jgi:hypothetical protein
LIWGEIFQHYKRNLKANISLGIMLVFVFLFTFFLPNIFLASGTLFLDYGLSQIQWWSFGLELILVLLALIFYSIFVTLIIFAVRKEMSTVKVTYYIICSQSFHFLCRPGYRIRHYCLFGHAFRALHPPPLLFMG